LKDEAKKRGGERERLSRDRRTPQLEQAARQLEQAADQMQQAQNSGRQESTANQLRALSQLQQAQRLLESARSQSGQQSIQSLRQKAEDALKKQNEIEKGVQDLARSGKSGNSGQQKAAGSAEDKAAQIGERNAELANQIEGLQKDINQAARGLGQDKQSASEALHAAEGAIRNKRLPDKIRPNNQTRTCGGYQH